MTHKFTFTFSDENKYSYFKEVLTRGINSQLFTTIGELQLPKSSIYDKSPCVSADLLLALLNLQDTKSYSSSILRDVECIDESKTILLTVTSDKSFQYIFDELSISYISIRAGHIRPQVNRCQSLQDKPKIVFLMMRNTIVAKIEGDSVIVYRTDLLPLGCNSITNWLSNRYSDNKLSMKDFYWVKNFPSETWESVDLRVHMSENIPDESGYFCKRNGNIYKCIEMSNQAFYIEDIIHKICNLIGVNHTKYFYEDGAYYSIVRYIDGVITIPLVDIYSDINSLSDLTRVMYELNEKPNYIYKILLLDSLTLNARRSLRDLFVYVEADTNTPLKLAPLQYNSSALSEEVSIDSASALIPSETLLSIGIKAYSRLEDIFPKDEYIKLISSLNPNISKRLIAVAEEILK